MVMKKKHMSLAMTKMKKKKMMMLVVCAGAQISVQNKVVDMIRLMTRFVRARCQDSTQSKGWAA